MGPGLTVSDTSWGTPRGVTLTVEDLDRACRFCESVLGATQRFRDADRYASYDLRGTTIALATREEQPFADISVSIKVEDLETVVAQVRDAGANVVVEPRRGGHEVSAAIAAPDGQVFLLYQPVPPQ
jgi:predicted enzyme related to lactoylglutathione lyase